MQKNVDSINLRQNDATGVYSRMISNDQFSFKFLIFFLNIFLSQIILWPSLATFLQRNAFRCIIPLIDCMFFQQFERLLIQLQSAL